MLSNRAPTPEELKTPISVGQLKRVLEWHGASEDFRQLIVSDPALAGEKYELGFNPAIVRAAWDSSYAIEASRNNYPVHPVVGEYKAYFETKVKWRDQVKRESSSDDPRFKAWRARQIARNALENGSFDDHIIHAPFAIELTDGCTVGCWFCGVGATKFVEPWLYTPENAALWHDLLTVLKTKVGPASHWGFCYWATDPLDNPDYEKFVNVFCDVIGMFPQTTTAVGHKHPERIKALFKVSEARGCLINRFSVSTERFLRDIFAAYTPDELIRVEIVAQMPEGTTPKALAGAFMERAKTNDKIVQAEIDKIAAVQARGQKLAAEWAEANAADNPGGADAAATVDVPPADIVAMSMRQPGTIACVSGFLLNMVKKSVKLISPCCASDKWPLGYIVFEERTFADAAELDAHIEDMMDKYMPLDIQPEDRIRLADGLTYERVEDGFHVASPVTALSFRRPDMADYVGSIGDQISTGERTAGQIAMSAFFQHGVPEANTLGTLGMLYQRGLLVGEKQLQMEPAE